MPNGSNPPGIHSHDRRYTNVTTTKIPQESYYRDARTSETERLDDTPAYLPRDPRPLALLIVTIALFLAYAALWRAQIFAAGFATGWAARELAGPLYDQRGWAALVVFSIVGSTWMINERNRAR
jgi:hypothetical protein